jgi:hypothetical protein
VADNQDRITILCNSKFKNEVNCAIMDRYINPLQHGYQQIFDLGFKEFKKQVKIDKEKK